jgi:hypothetical protein
MEWLSISTMIVLAVVCFASVIASVILISCVIYKEERCADSQQAGIEEDPAKNSLFSAF